MPGLDINRIKHRIRKESQNGLPGIRAHKKMAPPERIHSNYTPEPANAPESAVLILLYEDEQGLHIPLIKRSSNGGVHSGQIGLPGGKAEPADPDHIYTALRETEEEIGVKLSKQDVLGELSPLYIPVSNFIVRPVIAYFPQKPKFNINPAEVDEIHSISLDGFLKTEVTIKKLRLGNRSMDIPFFCIGKTEIWGATAMIISELKEILSKKAAP
jgi:8-oxo-dGTP pyrophosphatase MutT (NUDIX family)